MEAEYAYRFGTVCERDIDVMLLHSFAEKPEFFTLFTRKVKQVDGTCSSVLNVELSKSDPTWGESDVTVRFKAQGGVYALLIEDKLSAEAQPSQCSRYFRRGELGIKNKEYDAFFVFLCAPEKYLEENEEAKKYPYTVSFEEMDTFFLAQKDAFSKVCHAQLQQALEAAKVPYRKVVNQKSTLFWENYVEYRRSHYPDLHLPNQTRTKSYHGDWPVYDTPLHRRRFVYIQHKMDRGYADLTFRGMADRQQELRKFLREQIGDYGELLLGIHPAGKAAVLRRDLGPNKGLDFQLPFAEQIELAEQHFQAIYLLHTIASKLDREKLLNLLVGSSDGER